MAEDLKKKNEEQLNEEQLDEVNGGAPPACRPDEVNGGLNGTGSVNDNGPVPVFKPV